MSISVDPNVINQKRKELMSDCAKAVLDLRFIQANSITCFELKGKAYLEVKQYMNNLADLQERLDKEMTGIEP